MTWSATRIGTDTDLEGLRRRIFRIRYSIPIPSQRLCGNPIGVTFEIRDQEHEIYRIAYFFSFSLSRIGWLKRRRKNRMA
jgi:hypothetical protein